MQKKNDDCIRRILTHSEKTIILIDESVRSILSVLNFIMNDTDKYVKLLTTLHITKGVIL